MGFTEILTLVFVFLKLDGKIDWSWWAVVSPEIVAVGFWLLVVTVVSIVALVKTRG